MRSPKFWFLKLNMDVACCLSPLLVHKRVASEQPCTQSWIGVYTCVHMHVPGYRNLQGNRHALGMCALGSVLDRKSVV